MKIAAGVTLAVLLPLLTGCRREASDPAPRQPESAAVESLDQLSSELETLQEDVAAKNREIARLLEHYQRNGGHLPDNFGPDLTEEQRALLASRFQHERLGLRATLQDILDRDREIRALQKRMAGLETFLPGSIVAAEGDTHEGLLRAYLKAQDVPPADVDGLLAQVSLQTPLVAGHRVWAYYQKGALGTWVTTGDAAVRPREAAQEAMRVLTEQRDTARREARSLKEELRGVRRDRTNLTKEVAVLRAQIGDWSREADEMRDVARQSTASARYCVGSKKQLRDRGVISGGLLKGTRVRRLERLEILDLSRTTELLLRANDHDLARIKKVRVLPDGFERDQDYAVHLLKGGRMARVALLDVHKFQRSTFVVMLE